MRDLFAILAILLAVISLGVFRVPDENALLSAGIKAEAMAAVYQARHPLQIDVSGRVVSVTGRVESEEAEVEVLQRLAGLQGVEEVASELTILPSVAPFVLRMTKTAEVATLAGHVPQAALAADLAGRISAEPVSEPEALGVAAGVPDQAWSEVAQRAADALAQMLAGEAQLSDRRLSVSGQMHLPQQVTALRAGLGDLPEGYELLFDVSALDDGKPYSLHVTKDPLMGQRFIAKLPPEFDRAVLLGLGEMQVSKLSEAPLPLDQPGFVAAVQAAVPVFAQMPTGVLSVAPGLVTLSGGPLPAGLIAQAKALRLPEGYALHLALVPQDDGPDLSLQAIWDGTDLILSGRVPADFDAEALARPLMASLNSQALDRTPYPDLDGWAAPLGQAMQALRPLQSGQVDLDALGLRLSGLAAEPAARQRAVTAWGGLGQAEIQLLDDGAPAGFVLTYDAATGGVLKGKLPKDLTPQILAQTLGLGSLRGAPKIAPEGQGAPVLRALEAVTPWVDLFDAVTLTYGADGTRLEALVMPGVDPNALQTQIAAPRGVDISVVPAPKPLAGTRRTHVILEQAQIFVDGYWVPQVLVDGSAAGCTEAMGNVAGALFEGASFIPRLRAAHALAELAAIGRACTRIGDLSLDIDVTASDSDFPALNRQLARRRAEALRQELIKRGVPGGRVRASGQAGTGAESVDYRWQ